MIARGPRARSGITLTEILIAILIMGVGLISLATLFPLGLLRLREAARYGRSGLLAETAADDMDARGLFYKPYFTQTWYWTTVTVGKTTKVVPRDPFVQDAAPGGTTAGILASNPASPNGVFPNGSPLLVSGLPFCYDPLWRSITGVVPNTAVADSISLDFQPAYASTANEARFGDGLLGGAQPFLRNDPGDSNPPSAHGLQRLTNFVPWSSNLLTPQYPFTCLNASLTSNAQPADVAGNVFTSIDDIVFNPVGTGGPKDPLSGVAYSSVLPDMTPMPGGPATGGPQADYKYTWFVTGRQVDAGGNGSQFVGEVVICDGRPFAFDPVPGTTAHAPAGETVVEAIFGFGGTSASPNRSVLIRWPSSMPDPQVRPGGWICDVTYERVVTTYQSRALNSGTSFARCYWYQVGKRTDSQADLYVPNYRSMTLTLTTPVRAVTAVSGPGVPVHSNVALVMPSVINVFPRAFEVH